MAPRGAWPNIGKDCWTAIINAVTGRCGWPAPRIVGTLLKCSTGIQRTVAGGNEGLRSKTCQLDRFHLHADLYYSTVSAYDHLCPIGHAYFGFLDLVGRQNITALNVNLSAWPVGNKVKAAIAHHTFWLTDDKDALYNVGGAGGRRDPTSFSGKELGNELDLTVVWKIDRHQAVVLGWSHFWEDDFIQQTGISEDADLCYVQYAFKF